MTSEVRLVFTTFVPLSHQKSLYARDTSDSAEPSRRSLLFRSTTSFSYAAASCSVKNSLLARLAGRSIGVTVAKLQVLCRSGLPSAVRSACPATGRAIANDSQHIEIKKNRPAIGSSLLPALCG